MGQQEVFNVRRVLVANSSFPDLARRLEALAAMPGVDSVEQVSGEWGSAAGPGDVVVADYRADRRQIAEAGHRGAPWLHILSTGVDSWRVDRLDYPTITCSRGISGGPIAEWVLAMMLAHEKRLRAVFTGSDPQLPLGELGEQTLAVFGLGGIGSRVAALGVAFGMRVRAIRRRHGAALAPELAQVELVDDLVSLVDGADHVAVCAALTDQTRHAFDDATFRAMKPGVHLVNIARGAIVDTEALVRALDAGQVGYASLDVTDPEPLPDDHPLRHHPHVTVTSHVSGLVERAQNRLWSVFVDNLERFIGGRPLHDVVDPAAGY